MDDLTKQFPLKVALPNLSGRYYLLDWWRNFHDIDELDYGVRPNLPVWLLADINFRLVDDPPLRLQRGGRASFSFMADEPGYSAQTVRDTFCAAFKARYGFRVNIICAPSMDVFIDIDADEHGVFSVNGCSSKALHYVFAVAEAVSGHDFDTADELAEASWGWGG